MGVKTWRTRALDRTEWASVVTEGRPILKGGGAEDDDEEGGGGGAGGNDDDNEDIILILCPRLCVQPICLLQCYVNVSSCCSRNATNCHFSYLLLWGGGLVSAKW